MKRRRRVLARVLVVALVFCGMLINTMLIAAAVNDAREVPSDVHSEYCTTMDQTEPEIKLIGDAEITLRAGNDYTEQGVEVEDFCEIVTQETVGSVDTQTAGSYEVKYRAVDERGNENEIVRRVTVRPQNSGIIYLTFDDGPGPYTAELLDILAKYNVKATFFVTGGGDDDLILREHNEGHTVALHSLTHDYAYIYQNLDTYFEDLYAVQERVKNITGYTSYLMRFPGGSSNLVSARYDGGAGIMSQLVNEVEARGFTYFDWNISSGDAGSVRTADGVYESVVSRLEEGGTYVVLQHDIKEFSVAAVEGIIKYGLEHGFLFDKLSASSFTAHHGVNN
ncbi:polysaccharide deacetylase [Candidatus Saccharibacteria bacterium]|nr:polysaccharide deacetylase [Candidatus Saccharibacteria bacterium]